MLVPIILGGSLARQFGKRFELEVSSPREAIRALCSQLEGFEQAILSHPVGFRIWVDRELLPDAQQLDRHTGANPIRIVPVVAGAKDKWLSVIIGVVLIIASDGTYGWGEAMGGTMAGVVSGVGTSLVLSGISQILAGSPQSSAGMGQSATKNQSNLLFSGATNTANQGAAVPVCYGRMLVGSQVISAGIESVQMPHIGATYIPPNLAFGGGGK